MLDSETGEAISHDDDDQWVDLELSETLESLASVRAEIYKNLTEIDLLAKRASDVGQKVKAQCSYAHDNEAAPLPFFMEAFQEQLDQLQSDQPALIHCFPSTQTGLRTSAPHDSPEKSHNNKATKSAAAGVVKSQAPSVNVLVKDLFSSY